MKSKVTVKIVMFALAFFALAVSTRVASAKQHKQNVHGREVVVHTNPLPVILHRMVPPQQGRHVTKRELSKGKIPQPRAIVPTRNRN